MNELSTPRAFDEASHIREMVRDSLRRTLADRWRPDAEGIGDVAAVCRELDALGLTRLGVEGFGELPLAVLVITELALLWQVAGIG